MSLKLIKENIDTKIKRENYRVNISGLKKPKIKLQEGRNFMIIKDTVNKNNKDNLGVVITEGEKDIEIKVMNNIEKDYDPAIEGGGDYYYEKYMKYKIKYLALKKIILS